MADSDITKVFKINETYLMDFLTFLTFQIKKQEVEEIDDKFQDQLRKAKKGR